MSFMLQFASVCSTCGSGRSGTSMWGNSWRCRRWYTGISSLSRVTFVRRPITAHANTVRYRWSVVPTRYRRSPLCI